VIDALSSLVINESSKGLSSRRVLIFDLYGTLVDWRMSIGSFITLYAGREFVDLFFECDIREVAHYRPYSEVLSTCIREVLRVAGVDASQELVEAFILSFAKSPPFPDTIHGLMVLRKQGFKVAVLSNTERRLIDITLCGFKHLFDNIITAEDVKAYKPSIDAFKQAYRILGVEAGEVVHVSAYPQYDLIPASRLGAGTVLLDRGLGYNWSTRVKSLHELSLILSSSIDQ